VHGAPLSYPLLALALTLLAGQDAGPTDVMVGCYPCDSLARRYWHDTNSPWAEQDSIEPLSRHGFDWLRFGITTQSHPELANTEDWAGVPWDGDYWSCREMGERVLSEAAANGMRLYLCLFLSDTAAHAGQQIPPAAWENAGVEQTCRALEDYCFETTRYFADCGLDIEVYEVGNEIERGILGFRPHERVRCPPDVDQLRNTDWMRQNVWKQEALMLTAAIRGIKRADPDGRIVLHAATRPSPEDGLVVAFFAAMAEAGVPFDYAGLSYYPWSGYESAPPNEDWRAELAAWVTGIAALGKQVVICEYSYPHHPVAAEPGRVVSPLPGFPFSPEGQAAWLREFLTWCMGDPRVVGSFYFYPDRAWPLDGGTDGLFLSDDGRAGLSPALLELQAWTAARGDNAGR